MKVSDMSDCNQKITIEVLKSNQFKDKKPKEEEEESLLQKKMPEKRPKLLRCQEIKFKEPKLRKSRSRIEESTNGDARRRRRKFGQVGQVGQAGQAEEKKSRTSCKKDDSRKFKKIKKR